MAAEKFEIVVIPMTEDDKWPDAPNWIGVAKGNGVLLTYVLVPFDLVSMIRGDDEDAPQEDIGSATVNKPMPKLPTLAECQNEVQSCVWGGGFKGTSSNITEIVYNFISRQLSA